MSYIYGGDFGRESVGESRLGLPLVVTRAAGAVLFLVLVVGLAAWAYRLSTRDVTEVPIIRAMEGPARVQPEEPGGLRAAHQGLEVNSVLAGLPASPDVTAVAAAFPLPTLAEEDGPQGQLVELPTAPRSALSDASGDLRMPQEEPQSQAAAEPSPGDSAAEVAAMIEAALGGELAAGPEAGTEEVTADMAATPRPRTRPADLRPARATATAAVQPAPAVTPPASAPAATAPPASTSREIASVNPGSRLVQLGAFDSETLARRTWGDLAQRHGDLLGAKSLFLERVTHNARVFYRLRVAGFENTDQTMRLCEQLRGRGVDCIPVTVN